jgi:hypothetical protein
MMAAAAALLAGTTDSFTQQEGGGPAHIFVIPGAENAAFPAEWSGHRGCSQGLHSRLGSVPIPAWSWAVQRAPARRGGTLEGRWSPQAFLGRSKHAPQRALSGGGYLFATGRGGARGSHTMGVEWARGITGAHALLISP